VDRISRITRKEAVFEMLVLYGLVGLYIIIFFSAFAFISAGYLMVYLVRRRLWRSRQRKGYRAGLAFNPSGRIQLANEGCGE
jgi:hypothetical protein